MLFSGSFLWQATPSALSFCCVVSRTLSSCPSHSLSLALLLLLLPDLLPERARTILWGASVRIQRSIVTTTATTHFVSQRDYSFEAPVPTNKGTLAKRLGCEMIFSLLWRAVKASSTSPSLQRSRTLRYTTHDPDPLWRGVCTPTM